MPPGSGATPRYVDALVAARALGSMARADRHLRVVLGGNANVDFLIPALRVRLAEEGVSADVATCDFGNWIAATFDPEPADAWVIWLSAMGASRGGTARPEIDVASIAAAVGRLAEHSIKVVVILPEPLPIEDDPFSPFVDWRAALLAELRATLPAAAVQLSIDHLIRRRGIDAWVASRYWEEAKIPCHPDSVTAVGTEVAVVLSRMLAPRVKAIALDLDDTIWGGLVGEVGPEGLELDPDGQGRAYLEMQRFLLDLSHRGIALGVVSKNDDSEARRPFHERPEMILSLDDLVSFEASWTSKHEAIVRLGSRLNVGIDSVCFLDDSPAEREEARHMLPALLVPELPAAPEKRVLHLVQSRLFLAPQVSAEDRGRVEFYRQSMVTAAADVGEYLAGLDMELRPARVDRESFDRVLSLLHKTNQFNLTLWRPSPSELTAFVQEDGSYAYAFRLTDRLGDAGIIAALLARVSGSTAVVEAWVMSCRVFGRGVEWAMAEHAANWLRQRAVTRVLLPHVEGPRNALLREIIPQLGATATTEDGGTVVFQADELVAPGHYVRIVS